MHTSESFLKSGAYVFSHLLVSFGLLVLFSAVVSGTWHCKNQECTEPVYEGRTTHQYNPSDDAIKNGYIAVEPHLDCTVYRLASQPFIVDVEVNGKRGFLPRSLVAITKDHIGNDEYLIIESPSAPSDTDPYVEKSSKPEEKSPTISDAESQTKETPPEAADAAKKESVTKVADLEAETPSEVKDASVNTNEIDDKAGMQEKVESQPVEVENDSIEKIVAEPEKKSETQTDQSAETEQTEETSNNEQPTEAKPPSEPFEVTKIVKQEEADTKNDIEEIPVRDDGDKDIQAVLPKEEVAEKSVEPPEKEKAQAAGIPVSIADAAKEPVNEPPKPQNIEVKPVVGKETVESEQKIPEVEKPMKATPELPSKPALDESKKTVVADQVPEATTVAPTAAVKDAQPATVSPSAPIEQPSTVPKMPEPKVTFQDPMRNSYGSMPQLDLGQHRPVFTTKLANRFHDHHHHHHHGAHGHDHGAHGHDHHHDHDHDHKQVQNQYESKKVEIKEEPTKASQQPAANVPETEKIVPKEMTHDHHDHDHHHHDHDHHHKQVQDQNKIEDSAKVTEQSATSIPEPDEIVPKETLHDHEHDHAHHNDKKHDHSETALEPTKKGINPADLPVDPALLVNANFTFIPPEDATQSPVNYTQLVIDAKEGKTVPGFLNDALDKEPSAGYPVPPPLDPAAVTEAPKIPGSSDDLPTTDIEAAVQSIDRYNQHGRARFLPHRSKAVPALTEGAGSKEELPAAADTLTPDHPDEHHHHDHDGHHHDHGHEHHDHPKPVTEAEKSEGVTGSCSARAGGGEGSCEDVDAIAEAFEAEFTDTSKSTEEAKGNAKSMLHDCMVIATKYWLLLVNEFEKISPSLRLSGMGILAAATAIFLMVASSDRSIRKTMERGFEEYDHKKETELIALREQVQTFMKERQELSSSRPPVASQPPLIPRLPSDGLSPPCPECSGLKSSVPALKKSIADYEQLLRELGENNATLLRKDNEQTTGLLLMTKERDDLRRELEGLKLKLSDLERRQVVITGAGGSDTQKEAELISLRHRVDQLQSENDSLRSNGQSFGSSDGVSMAKLTALQTERDEAASNVRLLKQLLGEKEEEIRKSRASEASGGASARELQEKADEARSYRKQVHRLQEELDTIKRDRESQIQIRCQSFRIAADKAQRDALMARQETIVVRQQLEELCRKYGEQVPSVVIPQIANGTVSPPGIATPPMMYSGMAYPPGPPPPTFEAFRQHVLSHSGGSSGYISPQSPGREQDRDRVRERKGGKKNAQDYPRNGKEEYFDDSDTERERKRDRSKR